MPPASPPVLVAVLTRTLLSPPHILVPHVTRLDAQAPRECKRPRQEGAPGHLQGPSELGSFCAHCPPRPGSQPPPQSPELPEQPLWAARWPFPGQRGPGLEAGVGGRHPSPNAGLSLCARRRCSGGTGGCSSWPWWRGCCPATAAAATGTGTSP